MSVRFKFKNDLDYQPIPCDGYHISVRDLKKSIVRRKKLGKVTDFDLVVTNSQTNHVYNVDDELIAKNTTLVVQRAPLSEGKKKVWEEETGHVESVDLMSSNSATNSFSGIPSLNISQSLGDTEEDKISKMMSNSSEMYSEKHWTRYRGQKALPEGAKPPPHWKCSKCLGNHWVTDCPFANNDLKRTTGIPRSFLKPADSNVPGAKINPQGLIVVNEMEKLAYSEKKIEKNPWLLEDEKPSVVKVNIPSELLCPICKELLCDAVMMPCCAGSACDECARNGIIENEGGRCTVCGEVANPEELIPYRLFRDKVDRFRNQTGYSKPPAQAPAPVSVPVKPSLPDIVLPDPTDNNFKFDALIGHRANPGLKVEPPNLSLLQSAGEVASRSPTKTPGTPGTPTADSPPRRTPHTPTSTPPRSPSTPRSRSGDRRSPPPLAPASLPPMMDMSVPPPNMTLLPPGNVLSQPPVPHYHQPPPHYHHPPPSTLINPAEDPLAAFEAAMRKLDSKKANRGRSPPRAYQDGGRSRSRERYRDYYERSRDYSPRRRSPGYYSPPRRGDSRAPHRRSPSPGKGGGSRRRFVHEIPPETEQEKRERERYEREFAERERRKGESYEPSNHKHRVAPTPPRDFLEREVKAEHKNDSNRTPSLSPEPLTQHSHHNIKSSEMEGQTKLPIIRDERDLDNSDEKEALREASPRRDKMREGREEEERNERRARQEDPEQRRSRERETRYQEGRDDRSRYRDRERDRGRHDRRDRDRERSRDRHDRDDKERNIEDERSKDRDRHDKENISLDNGHVEHSEEDKELRKSKKEKKSKKSKKKNKKKDRDTDSDGEEEEKVSKKKKTKKDRKKKDKEHDVSHEEEKEDDAGESKDDGNESDNERSSGPDSSPKEPSSDVKQLDQSKFINSFSEAKVDETKTKLSLPTLVFNDKTEELAPKETKEEASDDQTDKDDSFETKLSKWEEDELNLEAQQIHEQSKLSKAENGPSAIKSSKERHHVETDRDEKKRKSRSVGEEEDSRNGQDNQIKKKKKKRKSISEAESDESEDEDNKSKKKKKKKKGLDIPEKTLKKLLKKNLLKKKALENLLKDGPKKKKKKRKSGDRSDSDHSDEDNSEDRIVRRVKSSSEKPARREDSDEEREVKSSREGNLQIRVDNASSVREDSRSGSTRTLTNSIQASLMKLSRGVSRERESPARKSVKERLGPVGGGGGESLRERLGRKVGIENMSAAVHFWCQETGGKAKEKEKESPREGNLGSLPADLKAWADRKASSPSPTRRKQRRRSRSREKMAPARDRSRSRDRRRRSRSRGDQRRKRSRSAERSRNGEKIASKSNGRSYSIKRRKNDRLDKDRGRHSDSD